MFSDLTTSSKFLAFVLRHQPESIGLRLDEEGWTPISELVTRAVAAGHALSFDLVMDTVNAPGKRRYELSVDGTSIRAIQGHSTRQVQRQLAPSTPPAVLFHGTATRFVESILAQGLVPAGRHHVHLSSDRVTALEVGRRHGQPVIFTVHAHDMEAADFPFYLAENGVWLTDSVPSQYLSLESPEMDPALRPSTE